MKSPLAFAPLFVACFALSLLNPAPAGAVVTCTSPNLPPACGEYQALGDVTFANPDPGIIEAILQGIRHYNFLNPVITPLPGGDELEEFDSSLDGTALITPLVGPSLSVPFSLTGPVQVITDGKTGNTTGMFTTELISMSLSGIVGGIPVIIRESPSLPSTGQTTITDVGGGNFQIDSFFDVFTEISVNGGAFVPATGGSKQVVLVPEPTGALLCFLGLGAMVVARRKR